MGDCDSHVRYAKTLDARTSANLTSILDRLKQILPTDVPDLTTVNHLRPLELTPQLSFYGGPKKASVQSTDDHPVLRANRLQLRKLLGTNIDVHWGSHIIGIEQSEGGVILILHDGSTYHGDVLVGADGVNSIGTFEDGHGCELLLTISRSAHMFYQMLNLPCLLQA